VTADRKGFVQVFAGATSDEGSDTPPADVEIDAAASAVELRVRERPHTRTGVTDGADVRKDELARRENLPDRLEPGGVYPDVRVHRRISGHVAKGRD
jgi:hypothetical protein